MNRNRNQKPGAVYKFRCGHESVLPEFGISNNAVYWRRSVGLWNCRPCDDLHKERKRHGVGPSGVRGRILHLLTAGRRRAKLRGYEGPKDTAEEVLRIWLAQKNKCAACERPLDILDATNCAMDHDHKTGKVRSFICTSCNTIEGMLASYDAEQINNILAYVRWVNP